MFQNSMPKLRKNKNMTNMEGNKMQKLSIIHHRAVFKLPQTTVNTPRLPTLLILTRPDYTMLYTTTPTTPAVAGRGDGGRQVGVGGGEVGLQQGGVEEGGRAQGTDVLLAQGRRQLIQVHPAAWPRHSRCVGT